VGPRRAIWAGEVEQREKVERWAGDVRAGGGPHKKAFLSRQLSQAYASKKLGLDEAKKGMPGWRNGRR